MEVVIANLSSTQVRRERLDGRDYDVAPATLIVPGVLNGSKGPLYYPPQEVANDPHAWNGMPLVLGHPKDEQGDHTSARQPKVIENWGVGWVFAANFDDGGEGDGKLVAEAWFDVEKTQRIGKREGVDLLGNLRAGKPIEVSTGLFTDDEPARNGATHNGKSYAYVARNYRPDHLAVLVSQRGACSTGDGCGINVNEEKQSLWQKLGLLLGITDNSSGKYGNPRSGNTGKFKPHGSGSGKGDLYDLAQLGSISLSADDYSHGASAKAEADQGQSPPSWVGEADKAIWEKAKAAASKGDFAADTLYAATVHIYRSMGGTIAEVEEPTTETIATDTTTSNQEADMAQLSEKQRGEHVSFLVTNCECFKGKATVLANREAFSDDDLMALKKHIEAEQKTRQVANAATKGLDVMTTNKAGLRLRFDPSKGTFVGKRLVANAETEECEEGDEECMAENGKMPAFIKEKIDAKKDKEDDDEPKDKKKTYNSKAEWLKDQPDFVQEQFALVENATQSLRNGYIKRLTANVEEAKRKAALAHYSKMKTGDLKTLVDLLPTNNKSRQAPDAEGFEFLNPDTAGLTDWSGAAGGGAATGITANDDEDAEPTVDLESVGRDQIIAANKEREERGAFLRGERRHMVKAR